jgi:hypothetical protein
VSEPAVAERSTPAVPVGAGSAAAGRDTAPLAPAADKVALAG